MAKLTLSLGNSLLGEIPLVKETTTIGRNKDNDIVLDNLSASGHHAQVIQTDSKYTVEDLGSTNGTLVNGQKIDRKVLEDNDVIAIGRHELRFIGETERVGKPSDFEKTVFVRMPSASAGPSPASQSRPQNLPPSVVLDLYPPAETKKKEEGEGGLVKILAVVVAVLTAAVVAYISWKKMGH
ncbi:putative FHA domain-containing protein [Gammaproteobacteria bacterium]